MSTISSSTTSTTAYKVTADTTGTLVIQTGATPTTAVTVDASQNVGIGGQATTPIAPLQVGVTEPGAEALRLTWNGGSTTQGYASIGFSTTQTATQPNASIRGEEIDTSDYRGNLVFSTRATNVDTDAPTERMRIDSSGNVGIGTASPNANSKLDVAGISQSSNASYPAFQLYNSGLASNAYFRIAYDAANNLVFNNVNNAYNSSTEFMRIDSSGNLLVNTTTAQTGAKLAVTGGIQGTIQSGTAVASTSGTSINFTGIPSWVKRITVMFSGVSTNGTSYVQVQLGTGSTTYTTSGYDSRIFCWTGGSQGSTATSGILIDGANSATATASRIGSFQITNITGNTWIASGVVSPVSLNGSANMLAGNIALSATLTAVRITTVNGTDTFDAGSVNIMYEG